MPQYFLGSFRVSAQAAPLLCLCVFLIGSTSLSIRAQATEQSVYSQKVRTFHTPEEFAQLTKGEVIIQRTPKLKTAWGDTMIASKDGIVFQKEDGSYIPLTRKFPLPYEDITALNIFSDSFWIGTTRG